MTLYLWFKMVPPAAKSIWKCGASCGSQLHCMQLQCQSIVCDASAWFKVCFYPFVTHVKFVLSFRASRSTSAISRAVAQSGGASKVPPAGAPVKFHFRGNDRGCNVVFVFNRQPLTLAGEHHPYMNENEVIRLAHSYFQGN